MGNRLDGAFGAENRGMLLKNLAGSVFVHGGVPVVNSSRSRKAVPGHGDCSGAVESSDDVTWFYLRLSVVVKHCLFMADDIKSPQMLMSELSDDSASRCLILMIGGFFFWSFFATNILIL